MTLVNVDTHVGPDPKTHVSETENFMGRSTSSPAACDMHYAYVPKYYVRPVISMQEYFLTCNNWFNQFASFSFCK